MKLIINVFLSFILAFISASLFAQQVNREAIMQSGMCYYGHGSSYDFNEARDHALGELSSQIAVHIQNEFTQKVEETENGISENVNSVIQSHSSATLHNVKQDVRRLPNSEYDVFCYLEKSEVQAIFLERKQLIADIFKLAVQFENEYNFAHALKQYYFAVILLNSIPDQNIIFKDVNYTKEIPRRINKILSDVKLTFHSDQMISEKEREVTLSMQYKSHPVSMLDFTFWDGSSEVLVKGRDGMATFHLYGGSVGFDKLKVDIKYMYYNLRNEYQIIASLWPAVVKPRYDAQKSIALKKAEKPVEPDTILNRQDPDRLSTDTYDILLEVEEGVSQLTSEKIVREANEFLGRLSDKDTEKVKETYGDDPYFCKKVLGYMQYNDPTPLDTCLQGAILKTGSGYEIRRVRMLHKYPTLNKMATEYIVLDFDENGNLVDLNTCITKELYQKFVTDFAQDMDFGNRQEIIKFLEKYRTSFLVRDIQTVRDIFAEEALIIVGRKIQRKKLPETNVQYIQFQNQPDYEYLKMTKNQFITRQERVFQSQQDISLDFSTFNIVRKNDTSNVYGVAMRQSYASTTYSDEGHLFLLIDFDGEDPLIYVRAWQPNVWNNQEMIDAANFKIYK